MVSGSEIRKGKQKERQQRRAKAAGSGALVVAIALAFVTKTQTQFSVALVVMFALLTYSAFQLQWIIEAAPHFTKIVRSVLGIMGIAVIVEAYGVVGWPPVHRHALSKSERERFEKPLKELKQPATSIQLACAPSDEADCEYAADLIPLFGESGWKVSGEVVRISLIRPMPGIILAQKGGDPATERNWDSGSWHALTPDFEGVRKAFVNIGIEPDSTSGSIIPENQIDIYVGHEREDESAPTNLTRAFDTFRKFKNNEFSK